MWFIFRIIIFACMFLRVYASQHAMLYSIRVQIVNRGKGIKISIENDSGTVAQNVTYIYKAATHSCLHKWCPSQSLSVPSGNVWKTNGGLTS